MSERGAFSMRLHASASSRSVKLSPMPRGIAVTRFCAKDGFCKVGRSFMRTVMGCGKCRARKAGREKRGTCERSSFWRPVMYSIVPCGRSEMRFLRGIRGRVVSGVRPRRQRHEDACPATVPLFQKRAWVDQEEAGMVFVKSLKQGEGTWGVRAL